MSMVTTRRQQTLARDARVHGIGFLTEADVSVRFVPAADDAGIVFQRVDLPGAPVIPARVCNVVPRQRRTAIRSGDATVEMVEHVMAALAGLQIDNCTVEINAGETPGCDGSSIAFVDALQDAGIIEQTRPRRRLVIDRPIAMRDGKAAVVAHPSEFDGLSLAYHLDYAPPIGRQSRFFESTPQRFVDEIAPSRTFLLEPEADALRQSGLGQRLSESDLLVFDANGPINNSLRFPDECVRHKILDMLGDLALAGLEIVGSVVAQRSGHQLNAALVRALLEQIEVEQSAAQSSVAPTLIDINQIMKLLPHRYPFLLVDRVVELEADRRVVAIKNVTINEPFFQGHWPDRPIMPGVLILEALAQAAGVLIAQRFDASKMDALIASIDGVKMRRPVVPGDQLWLEGRCRRLGPRTAEVYCEARVGTSKAAEARFRFVFVEKERAA
jgi:UDP-3-O-[3-hydroxymyristoyl] N-acetylglucosamine deacetylase/3-hydroxyacyl-[acyl-carrier-protein] dehydratase